MRLAYYADPLCSWCYGFGPELAELLARHPGLGVDLVMGGLRPFNREPMSAPFREMLRGHWAHVRAASGLPISEAVFAQPGFAYDTEPPCRAVVAARRLDPGSALGFMQAVQAAFYRDGRDVTQACELADIAAARGLARETFLGLLESDAVREETRRDFAAAREAGVSAFPTLAVARGAGLYLVASGFATADVLAQRLAQIALRVPEET